MKKLQNEITMSLKYIFEVLNYSLSPYSLHKLKNMVVYKGKTSYSELSHIIPHKVLALRDSSAKSLWGFILLIKRTITMKKALFSLVLSAILFPSISFARFDVSLKYGSTGPAVSDLQDFLQDQVNYTGKIDGKFGLGTQKAVIAFQSVNDLQPDGYFGMASRTKANSILSDLTAASDAAEQQETGTITPVSTVKGCTLGAKYSVATGQPCNTNIIPIAGIPEGCTAISGYSVTTGQKCDGTIIQPVTDSSTQAKLDMLAAQLKAEQDILNSIAQNTLAAVPVPPVVTPPVVPPPPVIVPLAPIQDPRWFSVSGIDSVGGSSLNVNDNGEAYISMSPLKQGTVAIVTMDNGSTYNLSPDNNFWITDLFDPYFHNETIGHIAKTWTITLTYQDPTYGTITGTIQGGNNINIHKTN